MTPAEAVLLGGIIFPESTLHSPWFAIMAAFVAINTVVYSALAVAKVLPKVYPNDWLGRRFRRSESRSISPEPMSDGENAFAVDLPPIAAPRGHDHSVSSDQ